jgi:protein-S-isoprenylcysteine O-methyltransferase Ste14
MKKTQSATTGGHSSVLRPLVLALISITLGAILLLIGGRWNWLEGWLLAGSYAALLIGSSVWVEINAPDLSEERMQAISHPGSLHERFFLAWVPFVLVVTLVVAALDGGRYDWSHIPLWLEVVGFGLFAAYAALNVWAAVSNPFLSATARVQEDRDHQVVETGPYRLIRHPMYLGLFLLGAALPLALGSFWALIPGSLFSLTFIYRTAQEDSFLSSNLPGYEDYMQRTQNRLIPGIW